ncbi:MAG: hypothetical protein WDM92_04560 [Caulobacteraceae bacterium]
MTRFRAKLWTGVGAALLIGAGGALEACSKHGASPEGPAASTTPASGAVQAAAGEGGEGGSEGGGEAGAQQAFNTIPADSKLALRLAQLKGFVLIALKQTDGPDAAGILLSQGLLETYDKNPAPYKAGGIDEALLRKASKTGKPEDLKAALANIEAAQAKAGGDPIAVAKGLVDIAAGLYQGAVQPGSVDPIDYQHSLGAALAAQELLHAEAGKDKRAKAAEPEMKAFVALWPTPSAPKTPTPAGQVAAQASRLELELS